MAIFLATRDAEVAARCRRAVSAEHELEVVDGVDQLAARMRVLPPEVVILDSAVLNRPLEHEAGQIVGMAGAARVIPPLNQWQCWEFMIQANKPCGSMGS